jgi:hypothetical protein
MRRSVLLVATSVVALAVKADCAIRDGVQGEARTRAPRFEDGRGR